MPTPNQVAESPLDLIGGTPIAYLLARLMHPGLSHAIEQNAVAAALWVAAVSLSAGVLTAACMSP